MNLQLGNLDLKDIVSDEALEKIQGFLDENGFKKESVCADIENVEGNYHIFDIPRQIVICGKEKMFSFVKFLQDNDLVASGFKERLSLTYTDKI